MSFSVKVEDLAKRYNREWIFRDFTYHFTSGNGYVILGPNGSGKSTLLQILCGSTTASKGSIQFLSEKEIKQEHEYKHVAIASPYLELIEEYTLSELIAFQSEFKPFSIPITEVITRLELEKHKDKAIKFFSSGMKQRVKLGLAILSNAELVLLDEPTSNLDAVAVQWYKNLIPEFKAQKLIIVCSNEQENDYFFCENHIQIRDYKR